MKVIVILVELFLITTVCSEFMKQNIKDVAGLVNLNPLSGVNFTLTNKVNFTDSEINVTKANCYIKINESIYDLSKLNTGCGYIMITDRNKRIKQKVNNQTRFFDLSFCSDISCENRTGLIVSRTPCRLMAGTVKKDKSFEIIDNQTLRVTLPEGEICNKEKNQSYKTYYDLICDPATQTTTVLNENEVFTDNCTSVIKIKSKNGI